MFDRVIYPIAVVIFGFVTPILAGLFLVPFLLILWFSQGDEALMDTVANSGDSVIFLFLGFAPIYLMIWFWLWLFERRNLWTAGLEWPGWLAKYLRGLLVGLLMFSASVAILAAFGFVTTESSDPGAQRTLAIGTALLIVVGWMVQGGAEELLTRGFVLPIIGSRYGSAIGIAISSLIFSALHLLNPNINLIALLNLFLFAVFAALYALFEGGLWGVFAIHAVWNWAQGNLFGFEVSGSEIGSAVIFDLTEAGPDWLTGGPFGPEGGLVVTAVLLASSILVFVADRRRRTSS
ncbi:MAG: type II CAAX endopeptidase family protein, partial [Chloroflexota bacterium]